MDPLTARHREAQLALRAATVRDLLKLWPALDLTRLDRTYPAWASAVGLLVQRNRRTSAGLASAYLQAFRTAKIGLGPSRVVLAEPLPAAAFAVALRVTSVVSVKDAMSRGDRLAEASKKAFVLSSGVASKHVMDGGRDTVRATVTADNRARGWQRVGSGSACNFCRMLIGRGAVYSEASADFASHGHCGCTAEPVYQ